MEDDNVKPVREDDPSEEMWSVYMNQVEKHNRVLVECWKADMNSILIFAGLFSASLTSFLVESYRTLSPPSPDPNQANLALVLQLVLSQSSGLNYTIPALVSSNSQQPTVPATSALICNTLWFLSLGFLCCALSATLVDQWARNYILATESRPSLHKRARISADSDIIHISLLLFFAGLVEFLRPINVAISNLMLGVLLLCGSLYLTRDCGEAAGPTFASMAEAREVDATEISQDRDERDFEAMRWTLSTLPEDSELGPFLGMIPRLGHLTLTLAHSRATTCLHAIWSLTMMAVPLSVPFTPASRDTLAFDEETLNHIRAAKTQIPSVADCADSTASVVARSLLDMFTDMATALEDELASFCGPAIALSSAENPTTPVFYVVTEALWKSTEDLFEVVGILSSGGSTEEGRALSSEALEYVRTFQRLLNGRTIPDAQLRIHLIRSPSLPHEAFNTLRRLFIRFASWDAAPCGIINILLGLSGSGWTIRVCNESTGIINHYFNALPIPTTPMSAEGYLHLD
ncbi:hypothetical protein B0H17DRAFT_1113446, partial [Mycena rosella]